MSTIIHQRNEILPIIKHGWEGNPTINGRFIDPHRKLDTSFRNFLKWRFTKNPKADEKKNDKWRLRVLKTFDPAAMPDNSIAWLGHATFMFKLNGVLLLTDPVLGRISGVMPRYADFPCDSSLLKGIDYVLLSHAHRDHCDMPSLRKIFSQNPQAKLLTGLETGKLVARNIPGITYEEAGWWQPYSLTFSDGLKITYLPAQHWSNRILNDMNKTLWGSMMIESGKHTIYFGGDSGYCTYPGQIAHHFNQIDYAIYGVGAYTPDFMMNYAHTSPQKALQMFEELGARQFIPMHYGTFDLADEPLGEPYRLLEQSQLEARFRNKILLPDVGQVITCHS